MSASDAQAKLASPEYWEGIGFGDPAPFDVPYVPPAHTTPGEQKAAGIVLASCLDEVMASDYVEQDLKTGEKLDPTETELGDGTVLVIDSENLAKWYYPAEDDREWQEPNPAWATPPIGSDFVGLWRNRQPYNMSTGQHFGDEGATFTDEKIIYSRILNWGVLLTRRGEDRQRFLATWALAAPRATPGGVSVPLSGDSEIFRTAEALPMEVGKVKPIRDLVMPRFGIRSMERIRKIKIVHAASASYEPEEQRSRLRKPKAEPSEVFAPQPAPSTA